MIFGLFKTPTATEVYERDVARLRAQGWDTSSADGQYSQFVKHPVKGVRSYGPTREVVQGEAPFAIREGACGQRKWCKLLVLKFDWSSA